VSARGGLAVTVRNIARTRAARRGWAAQRWGSRQHAGRRVLPGCWQHDETASSAPCWRCVPVAHGSAMNVSGASRPADSPATEAAIGPISHLAVAAHVCSNDRVCIAPATISLTVSSISTRTGRLPRALPSDRVESTLQSVRHTAGICSSLVHQPLAQF
jgi:hypothetical protein